LICRTWNLPAEDSGKTKGVFGQQAFVNGVYSIKTSQIINYQCDASQLIKIDSNGNWSIRALSLGMPPGTSLVAPLKINEMCIWIRAEYKIAGLIPRSFTSAIPPQRRLSETSIEPVPPPQRLTTGGDTISMRRALPDQIRACRRRAETCGREIMHIAANRLVTASLVVFTTLTAMQAKAADVEATSAVDAVTVYPDGASVTRAITADIASGDNTLVIKDFPLTLDPSSLRVEGEAGARLTIGAIDTRQPRAVPPVDLPELDKRIEALKDERANLQGVIAAATARRKFAVRFAETSPAGIGDKGEARPVAEWRAAFAAVAEEVASADSAIRDAQRKQRDIDREVARLESDRAIKPPSRLEVRIDLAAPAATKATLRVTYAVRAARWTPLYDARLDTGAKDRKPALELVRRAEITQTTGEDWSDVALSVSTVRSARGGNAPELNSLIVQYPPAAPPAPASTVVGGFGRDDGLKQDSHSRAMAKALEQTAEKADEQQAVAEVSGFQVVFKIPGRVSLGASEGAKSLRVSTATIAPDLAVRSVPLIDPTAFLEASFRQAEDAPLLPGRVALYRDGVFIGRGQMAAASKDETVRLGFGADDKVKVERSVVKRNEGSAGLILTTSKTDERAFKTVIRNGHDFPIRIAIEDQLPVSENEDIQVETLPSTTPPTATNLRDKRGVLEWVFEAKPGEVRDIAFAWRVRWPKDKGVVMMPAG
jgi:uncharacterized protein (TIGR02231 family)